MAKVNLASKLSDQNSPCVLTIDFVVALVTIYSVLPEHYLTEFSQWPCEVGIMNFTLQVKKRGG